MSGMGQRQPLGMTLEIGATYHWMTVIANAERYRTPAGKYHAAVLCECKCGVRKVVLCASLRRGSTLSCGCFGRSREVRVKHSGPTRLSHPGEYNSWAQMRSRCNSPTANGYANYGGRGIRVCERWNSFASFVADMGARPEGCSIERNDVNGHYEPENCRWATGDEQRNNTRRSRLITAFGETKTVSEWAKSRGWSHKKLSGRLSRGWSVEEALQ